MAVDRSGVHRASYRASCAECLTSSQSHANRFTETTPWRERETTSVDSAERVLSSSVRCCSPLMIMSLLSLAETGRSCFECDSAPSHCLCLVSRVPVIGVCKMGEAPRNKQQAAPALGSALREAGTSVPLNARSTPAFSIIGGSLPNTGPADVRVSSQRTLNEPRPFRACLALDCNVRLAPSYRLVIVTQ